MILNSLNSRRVDSPLDLVVSDWFSAGEHKSDEVTAWNPRGQLPTFRDGEAFVHESAGILLYLENQYPEKSLLPSNPAQRAKEWQSQ